MVNINYSANAVDYSARGAINPELGSIIEKVFLAYGGKDALAKISLNSLIVGEEKKIIIDDSNNAKARKFRLLHKSGAYRLDLESGDSWSTTVYDGVRAWRVNGKIVSDLGPDETELLAKELDREPSVLSHWSDSNYRFELRGKTLHNAIPVYAIEVSRAGNDPTLVFVDQKNYQIIGLSYSATDLGNSQRAVITIDYSEYRPAGGTLVAFKQVQYLNNKAILETAYSTVELGNLADDDSFRKPDKGSEIRFDKPVIIPFLYSHKIILVKARVGDGEMQDFLFDTGASQTLIDRRVAAENLLVQQSAMNMAGLGGNFIGQTTEIPKLNFGDLSVQSVQAVITDLSGHSRQIGKPLAGVLGTNVLSKFAVTIDYGKSQIILRDYNTYKAPTGANIVSFIDKKGPVVKASINQKDEVYFLVDTGAAFNNLPTAIAKKYQAGQNIRYTEGIGAEGRSVRLGTMQISSVKLGTGIVKDVSFTFASDNNMDPLRKTVSPSNSPNSMTNGILGNPFWQNYTLTIDYKMHQLVLQANPSLASRQQLEQLVSLGDSKLAIYRDFRASEQAYQQALNKVQYLGDPRQQARIWGRLGNLRRIMAKDLNRPEQARVAYEYFSKAQDLAHKLEDREVEGRILADWAVLYMDMNRLQEAFQSLELAASYAPQDSQVNVDYAIYLNKMHRYGDMRYYIDKALFIEPGNWQALWYRLKLCEDFSDIAQQKETLKEILKYYPWSKIAKDKLATLSPPVQSGIGSSSANSNSVAP